MSNTIISYLLYVVTLLLVSKSGVKFDYIIANIVSWLLSVLWSFYWNNKFVFKKEEGEKRNIWAALFKTYVSYGFGMIIFPDRPNVGISSSYKQDVSTYY